ncbi:MAG: chloride channel protein [Gammaproteobacteria bacterium]|nr:chloride channel protein [Gammaproteobacteria bacterium]
MQLDQLRHIFDDYRNMLPYAVLGVVAGACAAVILLCFEYVFTAPELWWRPAGETLDFELLPPWLRFTLPVTGALVLGLGFSLLKPGHREVGIMHVLSRMHSHYGHLPLANAIVQFIGGAFALATGQSGGREGPGVHLGAAINSNLAHRLGLPNNSQRILIACGTAGSIAAAFNTPLAGVIFAMEVIVTEYTVMGFMPVILAAVSATTVSRIFSDSGAIFAIPGAQLVSLWELPFILLLGVVAGAIVAGFIYLLKRMLGFGATPILVRFGVAGLLTGLIAIEVPQVMGMGYDTLAQALAGEIALQLLLVIIVCKLVATACSVGLGLPIGLIGPNLVIGGCLGAAMGAAGRLLFPELSSEPVLYVLIGMGAAMAAVLNAPLAAILAVVEFSESISVVFPSMLAIIAATLTRSSVFRQRSAHQTVLVHLQRNIPEDPVSLLLHQTNVQTVMERDVLTIPPVLSGSDIDTVSQHPARWYLLQRDGEALYLIQGRSLADHLATVDGGDTVDLTELDLRRWSVVGLRPRATLREALDTLHEQTVEALMIIGRGPGPDPNIRGVITRESIDQFYLSKY